MRWSQSIVLTIFGFLLIATAVGLTMWYSVYHLGMHRAYWLVPIMGAAGGAVGGLIKSQKKEEEEGHFRLCSLEPPASINAGTLGDAVVGIGGATAAVFLFSGTLKFDPKDTNSYVLLISVSFLAGVIGRRMIETASQRLLNAARAAGGEAGRKEAEEKSKLLVAMSGANAAKQLLDDGKYPEALEVIDRVLQVNPTYIYAYILKGHALKELNRTKEALATVNQALDMNPSELGFGDKIPNLLYNRACYKALLSFPLDDILGDLKQAVQGDPTIKDDAPTDKDLKSIWGEKKFIDLMSQAPSGGN
jgi:tetratricopeptide (TPR) repeat protein